MASDNTGGQIASAAVTQLGNYAVQAASNRRQFKYQKEAMKLQDEYNRQLWDYQNAYNTPQAQMQRFKDAGLNPNLIYGGGSASAGNAGPIQSLDVPSREAARGEVPDLGMRHLITRQMDAQYAATTQNIESQRTKAALTEVQTSLENLKLMREHARVGNYKKLAQAEVDTAEYAALRSQELFQNEKSKGNLMDQMYHYRQQSNPQSVEGQKLENEFKTNRNELAKHGIYSSDHPAFRILIQAAKRQGIDLGELLMKGFSQLGYLFK